MRTASPVPQSPSLHHLARPSTDGPDLYTIGWVLAAAFQDDPVVAWILPGDQRRRAALHTVMRLFAARLQPYGANQVNETGTAAALWAPPGVRFSLEDDLRFESDVMAVVGHAGRRLGDVMALMDEHHPRDPHHYLTLLGVVPYQQGLGIGSAMLRAVLDRADRDAEPAYVEVTSPHGRDFCERHGFEVTRELRVADCPPLWGMWRDPAV
jgi:ribosomal protein S18 acetylase RimI-like enzyme